MKHFTLVFLAFLASGIFSLAGCDALSKATGITGNIAGDVVDTSGNPEAYRTIILVFADTGKIKDSQTSDENGHFYFSKLDPGKYNIYVQGPNGEEFVPVKEETYNLQSGRTLNLAIRIDTNKKREPTVVLK
ncbi:MAG: carboxypeptidase regulatory-like domain-containing protein [bacterium]